MRRQDEGEERECAGRKEEIKREKIMTKKREGETVRK
jgi:hypothetical protein